MYQKVSVDEVINAVAALKDNRGSSTKQIVCYFKEHLTGQDSEKRDLTTHVRLALRKGVLNGFLSHCAGRYKVKAFLQTKKCSARNGNDTDKEIPQVNVLASEDDNSVNTSYSDTTLSCNVNDTTVSDNANTTSQDIDNKSSSGEREMKTGEVWTVIGEQKECEVDPASDMSNRSRECLWASSDSNEYNGNSTLQVRTNYSGCIQSVPQNLASHHHYVSTTIAPSFYAPSHVQEDYMRTNNNRHLMTDYVRHKLIETSEGLKRATEKLTSKITSPPYMPSGTEQHIFPMPYNYPVPVQPHPHSSCNMVYIPPCNFSPQVSADQNLIAIQHPQYVECSQHINENLWNLGDNWSSRQAFENRITADLQQRVKENRCDLCCLLKSQRELTISPSCTRHHFSKCSCKYTAENRKSSGTKNPKKRQNRSSMNKTRRRKVQQQPKRKTKNQKKLVNQKGKSRKLSIRRATQQRQRTQSRNQMLKREPCGSSDSEKNEDPVVCNNEYKTKLPVVEGGDMKEDTCIFSRCNTKSSRQDL